MKNLKVISFMFSVVLALSVAQVFAQEQSPKMTKEELATNNKLFIELAKKALKWEEPAEPVRIAGPIYFVGTKGLGAFLITTSSAVFDLDAGPVKIVLPDTGKRFMSMQVVNEDHYALEVVYGPAAVTYDKAKVGTRYVFFIIRTLANPEDAADMKAANAAQDAIKVEQKNTGKWEATNWDKASQDKIRATLNALASMGYSGVRFGKKDEVNPIAHLIGTAIGWGGNPEYAAVYAGTYPKANDGKTIHRLTVKDVPVDGFWSISVYNEQGFFQKNDLNAYSLNSLTAKPDAGGSYTIQFGGCTKDTPNCLPIVASWNYTVRLYRPRKEILDSGWKFPEAEP